MPDLQTSDMRKKR